MNQPDLPDIQAIDIDAIRPDPGNVYTHSDAEQQRLVGSISNHGYLVPIVVDADTMQIVGGHARWEAARACGYQTIPAALVRFESDEKRKAAAVALNASFGHWDDDALAALVQDLATTGFDLDELALEPFTIEDLLGAGQPAGLLGAPEEDRYREQYGVIIICSGEQEQEGVYNRLTEDGFNCRVVTT